MASNEVASGPLKGLLEVLSLTGRYIAVLKGKSSPGLDGGHGCHREAKLDVVFSL